MNNERMDYLLAYMDGLTRLASNDYLCVSEISECVKWIREELQKRDEVTTVGYDAGGIPIVYREVKRND